MQLQIPEGQDAWASHLQDVFRSLEISDGALADNVAASVAMYCRRFCPKGVKNADLVLLIARAFCSVNDRAAATRALESMSPHRHHVARWLEILSELHHFPEMLPYFSLGVIRPADWAGARLDRMWTLDFGCLVLSEAEKHEMMLYRSIRAIVESMLVFWDASKGEGVLGLKGLAVLDLERKGCRGPNLTGIADLLEYITGLFEQHKERRQWYAVPSLLNLDL